MKHAIDRIAAAHPNMTIMEFATRIEKSPWYIFEMLVMEHPERRRYPQPGEQWQTVKGTILTVSYADRFAVHWEGGFFSNYDDLKNMVLMMV